DLFPVMTSYIDTVRDAWPDARLVIIVPTYVTPVPYDGYDQFVSALRSYGESVAATVIDPVADGWYADVDLTTLKFEDGVHPNAVGNAVIAQKLVESLTASGVIREGAPNGGILR
ncbi:SGNH/GDSL hydrolase family protein, partial [Rhodococcus sp. (in: high G+C Gram-positive bacteria)]|uniref:SGNH/GDSL hydrolase family protein n=2 Tax=unclassified Rhodococcus (in: high G+C Gram-positive bacteria) TaxID=192944 RepID=UPI0025906E3F